MNTLTQLRQQMLKALRAGLAEARRRRHAFEEWQAKHVREADQQDQQPQR